MGIGRNKGYTKKITQGKTGVQIGRTCEQRAYRTANNIRSKSLLRIKQDITASGLRVGFYKSGFVGVFFCMNWVLFDAVQASQRYDTHK